MDPYTMKKLAKARRATTKKGKWLRWVAIGVLATMIGACVLEVVLVKASHKETTKVSSENREPPKKPANSGVQAAPQAQSVKDRQSAAASGQKDRSSSRTADNARAIATPADSDETLEREAKERRQRFLTGQLVNSASPLRPLSPDEQQAKKAPVPDANAQAAAAKRLQEAYGNEWTAATSDGAKQVLAKKLLQAAWEPDKDNASRYVLLRSCRDIATQAMDGLTAFKAIEDLDHLFQIDALEMRAEVLVKGASIAATTERHLGVANKSAEIANEAVANDNFTIAKQLNALVLSEARKGTDPVLAGRASQRAAEIDELSQRYEAVKAAKVTLKNTPADPEANLILGKYKCFAKGDWEGGLPSLALGSDQALKRLASRELAGAASSDEQAKLGDGWWELAATQEGMARKPFQGRAAFWYRKALPGLSGAFEDKVKKRLQLDSRSPLKQPL